MKKAFSLVELLVVIGIMAVVLLSTSGILINSFRARTKVESGDLLEQNGSLVLATIRDGFLKSSGVGVSCGSSIGVGSSSIIFVNKQDGEVTAFDCNEGGKIASQSANSSILFREPSVKVTGCNTFVTCDTFPSSDGRVSVANFSFVLTVGNTGAIEGYTTRRFETKVVVR